MEPAANYVQAAVSAVVEIHKADMPGDILVFLTGQVREGQWSAQDEEEEMEIELKLLCNQRHTPV